MGIIHKLKQILNRKTNLDKFIAGGGKIGNNCSIFPDVFFGSEPYLIKIGDNVRITSGVKFVTHDGGMWVLRNSYKEFRNADCFGTIEIGNNVHIGWNAIIMPNVKIGNNCIVGCGAVVTKDVPNESVVVGVPAHTIKTIEEYKNSHINRVDFTKSFSYSEKKRIFNKKVL